MTERITLTLIILPGIGGHPEFHAFLIKHLNGLPYLKVKSFPHGDFFGKPFSLAEHVNYWNNIVLIEMTSSDKIAILGISFGTVIIQSLPNNTLRQLSAIFLCSPIIDNKFVRTLVSVLSRLDAKLTAELFGKMMFWWSDRKVKSRVELTLIRNRLYDSEDKVYVRLWKRLLSIKDISNFDAFIQNTCGTKIFLLFGKSEFLRFLIPSNNIKNLNLIYIDGDHSLSISESNNLLQIFTQLIFDLNGEVI